MIKFVTLNYEIKHSTMEGRVKWFDDKRGYGFITGDDGVDTYVHYTAIAKDGYRTLKHNWRVTYDVVENFTVRYKILNNDGTYRNDLPSDTWKPQIFQIAKTNAGYRIVNVLTVLTGAK